MVFPVIFEALSQFNWITWIAPQNVNLAAITGSMSGLGLNPWSTFDWNISEWQKTSIVVVASLSLFLVSSHVQHSTFGRAAVQLAECASGHVGLGK